LLSSLERTTKGYSEILVIVGQISFTERPKQPDRFAPARYIFQIWMVPFLIISIWLSVNSFPVTVGQSKFDWFKQFLEPPNGIPSHDTDGRRFAGLEPNEFQNLFIL